MNEIQRLARNQCANYTDAYVSDGCLLELDGCLTCRYFRDIGTAADNVRCRYFESSVLPSDKALEARYYGGSKKNVQRCAMCHHEYVRTSNRQRYCTDCRERAITEGRRKRDARYRGKKTTV